MKTSHAAKRQGDSLRRGPSKPDRTHMWSIYAVAQAWSCLPSLCTSSGRAQAARQRVQCVAGEANRMDDDDQSVDMDKLVFRPNPERLGLELSHSDDEE